MKKKLAMSLAVVTLLLSACGGPASGEAFSSPGQTNTSGPSAVPAPSAGGNAVQFDPSATIEETVLVDDGYLNADIAAGKKANETVSFSVDELILLGFDDIADIELGFSITDSNYDDYLQTGSRQIKTSIADSYNYETDTYRQAIVNSMSTLGFTLDCNSEETVFDQKGIRVVSQTLATNSSGEQALLVEVENASPDMVYVSVGNISMNGLVIQSGNWSTDWISAGKRRVIAMNLSNMLDESYRAAFGLEDVGQVTYTFEPKDSDRDTLVVPQTLSLIIPGGEMMSMRGRGIPWCTRHPPEGDRGNRSINSS